VRPFFYLQFGLDVSFRIARRYPHQVGKEIARGINAGRIEFADKHLSMLLVTNFTSKPLANYFYSPQDLLYGYYSLKKTHGDPKKPLNWAIVEATAITEDGHIVPGRFCRLNQSSLLTYYRRFCRRNA
jgi:acetyl-CoA hydrolase